MKCSTLISLLAALLLALPPASLGQRPGLGEAPPVFVHLRGAHAAALSDAPVPGGPLSSAVLLSNPAALSLLQRRAYADLGYIRMNIGDQVSTLAASGAYRLGETWGTAGTTFTNAYDRYNGRRIARGASLGYARRVAVGLHFGGRLSYRSQSHQEYESPQGDEIVLLTERALDADLSLLFAPRPGLYRVGIVASSVFGEEIGLLRTHSAVPALPRQLALGGAVSVSGLRPDLFASHETVWIVGSLTRTKGWEDAAGLAVEYVWHGRWSFLGGYGARLRDLGRSRSPATSMRFGLSTTQSAFGLELSARYTYQMYEWRESQHFVGISAAM